MRKHVISAAVLAVGLGVSSSVFAANTCGGDIHFAKGKSSTQLSGEVLKNNVCEYRFYAKKGQELTVDMGKNDRPQAFLYSPVEKALIDGQPFILPKDGQYELRVGMTRNDARKYSTAQPFTMALSITAPRKADARQVNIQESGFAGSYEAVLPCLTCRGIDTFLSLYDDGSYTLTQRFLGVEGEPSTAQQGTWMVQGDAIVLQPEDNDAESIYLIAKDGDVYLVSREEAGAAHPKVEQKQRLKHQP